jgi:hypothetical protein
VLLRIIEKGGLGGLAHLDEPLLITQASELEENAHERQALLRTWAIVVTKPRSHRRCQAPGRLIIDMPSSRWCR